MNQQPIKTGLNNGIVTGKSGMPMKDITSNNDAEFSMSRMLFNRSFIDKSIISHNGNSFIQRESLGLSTKVVIDGSKTTAQKKWIGGNRDASSIISRRKINNTGNILSNTDSTSFKNVIDNNTAKDALIRTRSSGYRVPPAVTQKYAMSIVTNPTYLQIISYGLNYSPPNSNYLYGVYNYSPFSLVSTPIQSGGLGNAGRSYNLLTISRTTGAIITYPPYDVFDTSNNDYNANLFANQLNALSDNVIVVVFTFDEPQTNSNILQTALQRCGASSSFNSMINYRGAYVLVGIPGIGVNNGLERYVGDNTEDGDPFAVVNLKISIINGMYTYISG